MSSMLIKAFIRLMGMSSYLTNSSLFSPRVSTRSDESSKIFDFNGVSKVAIALNLISLVLLKINKGVDYYDPKVSSICYTCF